LENGVRSGDDVLENVRINVLIKFPDLPEITKNILAKIAENNSASSELIAKELNITERTVRRC